MKEPKIKTEVTAAICPYCNDAIFSRARHDMRFCNCGKTGIDGAFDYVKIAFDKEYPKLIKLFIPATKKTLYDDWNLYRNKFGIIEGNKIKDFETP